jgi:hypothetical protein
MSYALFTDNSARNQEKAKNYQKKMIFGERPKNIMTIENSSNKYQLEKALT